MTTEDIRRRIREFVLAHVAAQTLDDEDDIFARGYVNSLFALQLVVFVENEFRIEVQTAELEFDQIRSVAALTGLVSRSTGLTIATER